MREILSDTYQSPKCNISIFANRAALILLSTTFGLTAIDEFIRTLDMYSTNSRFEGWRLPLLGDFQTANILIYTAWVVRKMTHEMLPNISARRRQLQKEPKRWISIPAALAAIALPQWYLISSALQVGSRENSIRKTISLLPPWAMVIATRKFTSMLLAFNDLFRMYNQCQKSQDVADAIERFRKKLPLFPSQIQQEILTKLSPLHNLQSFNQSFYCYLAQCTNPAPKSLPNQSPLDKYGPIVIQSIGKSALIAVLIREYTFSLFRFERIYRDMPNLKFLAGLESASFAYLAYSLTTTVCDRIWRFSQHLFRKQSHNLRSLSDRVFPQLSRAAKISAFFGATLVFPVMFSSDKQDWAATKMQAGYFFVLLAILLDTADGSINTLANTFAKGDIKKAYPTRP